MLGLGLMIGLGAGQSGSPSPVASLDFANGQYSGSGLSENLNTIRASIQTDLLPTSPSGAAWQSYANNVPVIIPGSGLLVEEPRTNLFLNATAPVTQQITLSATGNHVLWVNGSGSATISAGTAVLVNAGAATQGNPLQFYCSTTGTVTVTISGSLNAVQLEFGLGATSFIPTAGSSVARAGGQYQAIGPMFTALSTEPWSVVVKSRSTDATPNLATIYRAGSGVINRNLGDANFFTSQSSGAGPNYTAAGIGSLRTSAIAALSSSSSDRRFCANGGAITVGTRILVSTPAAGAIRFGNNSTTTQNFNGFIERVDAFNAQISDSSLRTLSGAAPFDVIAWGDSLVARGDPGNGVTMPQYLSALLGKTVLNAGGEGENSTQIANRFALLGATDKPTIIWAGRNNYASPTTVKADIAAMVGALTTPNYIVIGVTNQDVSTEYTGQTNYNTIVALNADLATLYGTKFLDIRSLLIAGRNMSDPLDTLNATNDVPPASMRLVSGSGYLTTAINSSATSFTVTGTVAANQVIKIDNEYIQITTASGSSVTNCVRGYASSTAASHSFGAPYQRRDSIHYAENGREFIAQKVAEKITSLGWVL